MYICPLSILFPNKSDYYNVDAIDYLTRSDIVIFQEN